MSPLQKLIYGSAPPVPDRSFGLMDEGGDTATAAPEAGFSHRALRTCVGRWTTVLVH